MLQAGMARWSSLVGQQGLPILLRRNTMAKSAIKTTATQASVDNLIHVGKQSYTMATAFDHIGDNYTAISNTTETGSELARANRQRYITNGILLIGIKSQFEQQKDFYKAIAKAAVAKKTTFPLELQTTDHRVHADAMSIAANAKLLETIAESKPLLGLSKPNSIVKELRKSEDYKTLNPKRKSKVASKAKAKATATTQGKVEPKVTAESLATNILKLAKQHNISVTAIKAALTKQAKA